LQSLHVQSLTQIIFFCMFKTFKPWKWIVLVFVKCLFLLPNVHHSFWKLERILTLMIRRTKRFKLLKLMFIINLSTFGFKVFLILKIMDFENVPLTKVVHVYRRNPTLAKCGGEAQHLEKLRIWSPPGFLNV
jgi:hypothetical protein